MVSSNTVLDEILADNRHFLSAFEAVGLTLGKDILTFSEFKYWLQGFEYLFALEGNPDKVQWAEIKSQIDKVYEYSPVTKSDNAYAPIPFPGVVQGTPVGPLPNTNVAYTGQVGIGISNTIASRATADGALDF